MSKRLERSATNRMIGGVCGGIAEYLDVDATLVRIFFIVATVVTAGAFFLAYLAGLVLMPLPDQAAPFVRAAAPPDAPEAASGGPRAPEPDPASATAPAAPPPAPRPRDPAAEERRRSTIGYFLVALGLIFLLANVGAFRFVRGDIVWPLVLVGVGVLLLAQRVRR